MLMALLIATAMGVGFYELHKLYKREFPEVVRNLGFVQRGDRFEMPMGRSVVRIASSRQGQVSLSFDMSAIVGRRLRLKKRHFLSSTRAVTGDPLLDQHFDIDDGLAATAYIAPISAIVLQIFGEAGPGETLVCEAGVLELAALTTDLAALTGAWLTRFKIISRSIDRDEMGAEHHLRRNMTSGGPGLRLRSLQLLERDFAKSPSHKSAVMDGLHDEDTAVRIEAARQARAAPELEAIVRDTALAAELRIRAMDAYERVAPRDSFNALLLAMVTDKEVPCSVFAIGRLRTANVPELGKRFVRLLDVAQGERFFALVDALGRLGDESLEGPLLDVLAHREDSAKAVVCTLLGKLGTVRSVPVLRTLADAGFAAHAEPAIAQIQSRITGAEGGQLSVTSALDGAVSVAKR